MVSRHCTEKQLVLKVKFPTGNHPAIVLPSLQFRLWQNPKPDALLPPIGQARWIRAIGQYAPDIKLIINQHTFIINLPTRGAVAGLILFCITLNAKRIRDTFANHCRTAFGNIINIPLPLTEITDVLPCWGCKEVMRSPDMLFKHQFTFASSKIHNIYVFIRFRFILWFIILWIKFERKAFIPS